MAQNNEDGRFGEIANQAGVVIQTQQDMKDLENRLNVKSSEVVTFPGAAATVDNSTVRVDINDLVFTVGYNRGGSRGLLNNAIPVSSNCNGLYISKNKLGFPLSDPQDEEEVLQAISGTIRLIGQAVGGTNPLPDSAAHLKTNFTTRAAGSAHVTNTGTEILNPGDTVLWDLFRSNEISGTNDDWKRRMSRFGYSVRKVPLKLTKLSQAHVSFQRSLHGEFEKRSSAGAVRKASATAQGKFANCVVDFLSDMLYLSGQTNGGAVTSKKDARSNAFIKAIFQQMSAPVNGDRNTEFDDSVSHLIKGIMYMITDLDRRKVGKALSFSKPGKGVDILLGAA